MYSLDTLVRIIVLKYFTNRPMLHGISCSGPNITRSYSYADETITGWFLARIPPVLIKTKAVSAVNKWLSFIKLTNKRVCELCLLKVTLTCALIFNNAGYQRIDIYGTIRGCAMLLANINK